MLFHIGGLNGPFCHCFTHMACRSYHPHPYVVLHIYLFLILFSNGCLFHSRVSGGFARFGSLWSQVMFFLCGNSYDCLHPVVYSMTACYSWFNSSVWVLPLHSKQMFHEDREYGLSSPLEYLLIDPMWGTLVCARDFLSSWFKHFPTSLNALKKYLLVIWAF